MKIVIDIPDDEIPKKQEYMEIGLHFIDGTVCECTYPFLVLPKGHGRLIDADKYRHEWVDTFDSCYGDKCSILFKMSVDNAQTIIEAESEVD